MSRRDLSDKKLHPILSCISKLPTRTAQPKPHAQGRLSRSIRSNDRKPRIQSDIDVDALKNRLVLRVPKRDFGKLQQRRRDLFGFLELELDDVVLLWRLELGKLLEDLDLGLGLGSAIGVVW